MTATNQRKSRTRSTASTKKTSSQSDARRPRPKPFTLDHFSAYARNLVLDNGSTWEPEDFQLQVVEDLFAGETEVWLVVPEGNGKTTLMSGIALYHGDYTPDAMVTVGASSRDQCEVLHSQAAGFVRRTPGLEKRFRVFDGYRRIRCSRSNGRIQVFAADDRTGDGVIPTLAMLDELHRHRDLRLYRTWRGKLDKRGGQLTAISTAGEADSEFEEIRRRHRTEATERTVEGSHTRAAGGAMVLHDWSVPEGADVMDPAEVKKANPLPTITVEGLAKKIGASTFNLVHHKRFVCNQTAQTEKAVISEKEWRKCESELRIPDGTGGVIIGADLGWRWDTTAFVPVVELGDRLVVDSPTIVEPPRDGTATDATVMQEVLEDFDRRWNEITFVVDPAAGGEQLAQWVKLELGWEVYEHSQKPAPMARAAQRLLQVVAEKRLAHPGDPDLTRHVLNAAAKPVGEAFKFVKPKHDAYIDAAVGLAMGVSFTFETQKGSSSSKVPVPLY